MNNKQEQTDFSGKSGLSVRKCEWWKSSLPPRLFACLLLLVFATRPAIAFDVAPVRAELSETTAWTGEAVSLVVTLYSPGPFSGTAAFEIPQLPRTAFVKVGNPLVGSEQIEGESYLTQRQPRQCSCPQSRIRHQRAFKSIQRH
jgi:hypothetical protein